jgi:hypothetical protein
MNGLEVALAAVAVWRVTHLLVHEDGPGGVVARLRAVLSRWTGRSPLDCFLCASVWVAVPGALLVGETPRTWLLLVPALSGVAILLERVGTSPAPVGPAAWIEDEPRGPATSGGPTPNPHQEEEPDELLRSAPGTDGDGPSSHPWKSRDAPGGDTRRWTQRNLFTRDAGTDAPGPPGSGDPLSLHRPDGADGDGGRDRSDVSLSPAGVRRPGGPA